MQIDFKSKTLSRRLIAASALFLGALSAGFFLYLNSSLTDYSSWEAAWLHQRLYDVMHGLWYQTSLYRWASPIAYAHDLSNHLTGMHYLLTLPYGLFPGLNTYYVMAIGYNILCLFFFAFLFTRGKEGSDPADRDLRRNAAALIILLMSLWGLFYTAIATLVHPILFASPFFLASYWFSRDARHDLWFFLCVVAVSFCQDDGALWMFTYCFSLFVFEKKRRFAILASGLLGLLIFVVYSLYVQPEARWYSPAFRFDVELVATTRDFVTDKWRMSPLAFFLPIIRNVRWMTFMLAPAALLMAVLAFHGRLEKRHVGLLLVAPSPYWFSMLLGRAGWHHYLAEVWCVFIVLADVLPGTLEKLSAGGPVRVPAGSPRFILTSVLGALVFLAGSQKTFLFYPGLLSKLYGPGGASSEERAWMESNKRAIAEIARIPPENSLCFWTNHGIAAFIAGRPHFWKFPYAFDRADYLVMQKGASDSPFEFIGGVKEGDLSELSEDDGRTRAYLLNKQCVPPDPCRVRPSDVEWLTNYLVDVKGTHTVFLDVPDLVILKSKVQGRIPVPEYTRTLYWR